MKESIRLINIKAVLISLIIILLAVFVGSILNNTIKSGVVGLFAFILVFRLYFMPVSHEDFAKHITWTQGMNPYPKTLKYSVHYFIFCLVIFLGATQATNSIIWVVKEIFNVVVAWFKIA